MKYRTITGELADMHPSVTPERINNADSIEPDARRYACASCGLRAVFGAKEVLSMIV